MVELFKAMTLIRGNLFEHLRVVWLMKIERDIEREVLDFLFEIVVKIWYEYPKMKLTRISNDESFERRTK